MTVPSRRRFLRSLGKVMAVLVTAGPIATLGGCVESLPHTQLPELSKDPRPLLTPEQQKAAAAEVAARKNSSRDEAIKEIESKR